VGRLSSFVEAEPKRATQLIVVLVVALVITAAVAVAYAMELSFGPSYPSEETPITLVDGGVMWTQSQNITVYPGGGRVTTHLPGLTECNLSYIDFRWHWGNLTRGSGGGLLNESALEQLSTGSRAVVDCPHIWYFKEINGVWTKVALLTRITDVHGDGVFGIGDTMEFIDEGMIGEPLPEESVRWVALAYVGISVLHWEYSYAVQNGELHCWSSHNLNTLQPWWE